MAREFGTDGECEQGRKGIADAPWVRLIRQDLKCAASAWTLKAKGWLVGDWNVNGNVLEILLIVVFERLERQPRMTEIRN